jgi:hypothetical protein
VKGPILHKFVPGFTMHEFQFWLCFFTLNEQRGSFGCKRDHSGNLWYVVGGVPLFRTKEMVVFPAFGVSGASCCIPETPAVLGTCSSDVICRAGILSDCDCC